MFIFNAKIEDAERLEQTLIGRKDIADWLEKQAMSYARTGLPLRELLIGPRGSGKTHLLRVLYHRIAEQPEVQQNVVIAYMSEDEYGIDTYLDLLVRIFKACSRLAPSETEKELVATHIEQLKRTAPELRISYAERYLLEYLKGRRLLVLIENLNDIFAGIGEDGQSQWRDFIQTHDNTGIVATSQAIFKDVNNRNKPFFGYFHISYLKKLSFDDALELMKTLAKYDRRDDLLEYLDTDEGRGNIRAIYELTEGNHRLLVTFYNFLKADFKCELSRTFLLTLDKLKPYYESFLKLLSHQQQKIIQYLALQRIPQTGTQIAQNCFLQPTTVSKQMSELQRLAYVDAHKEGREAYYEITEPLLRICIEVNEDHEGIIKLFVDFLGRLYAAPDLKKSYLRFSLLQDVIDPALRNNYRDEARYYSRAIEAYAGGWKLAPEMEAKILSLTTMEERERMIDDLVQEGEPFDKDIFKRLIKEKEWGSAEKMIMYKYENDKIEDNKWFLLGALRYKQGILEEAKKYLYKVLKINPKHSGSWNILGLVFYYEGQFNESEDAILKSLEIKPGFENWGFLGQLYRKQEKFDKAETAYLKALEIKPDSSEVWNKLSRLYLETNELEKAKKSINQFEKYASDETLKNLLFLSASIGDSQQYFRAVEHFITSTKKEDSNVIMSVIVMLPLKCSKPEMIISILSSISSIINEVKLHYLFRLTLPSLIEEESPPMEQLLHVQTALSALYASNPSFHYLLKYFSLGIRYYRGGDKKALYELSKEERKAFFEWAGQGEEENV